MLQNGSEYAEQKEGKGLIRQGNGVRWVLEFVNDIPEGDVIEMNEEGRMCLRLRKNYILRDRYDELNESGQVIGSGFDNEAIVREVYGMRLVMEK